MEKINVLPSKIHQLFAAATGNDSGAGSQPSSDCPHKITNLIKCDNTGDGSIWNILATVVNVLALGVGVAVLLGIIFGAFLYATSGGSADQAKKGIGYIRNAVIALLLFGFMWALINFIIPGGLF